MQKGIIIKAFMLLAVCAGSAKAQQYRVSNTGMRQQEPAAYSYTSRNVTFTNKEAHVTLSGTLTVPAGGKFTKAVVLLSGSGPQNRNEETTLFNHRPFLVWADWLTRQGIAVLRYDDRGTAKSTGNYKLATTADLADDAEAAVEYLLGRPDMRGKQIGLVGHSEGGVIAPMVAARNKHIDFIVLLAAPGLTGDQLLLQQTNAMLMASGTPMRQVQLADYLNKELYEAIAANRNLDKANFEKAMRLMLVRKITISNPRMPADEVNKRADEMLPELTSNYLKYFITLDPAVYLRKVSVPVLAINGSLDKQVLPVENSAAIKAALAQSAAPVQRVDIIPGLNHLLQTAQTGSPEEYGIIEETVNPAVLKRVSDWIKWR